MTSTHGDWHHPVSVNISSEVLVCRASSLAIPRQLLQGMKSCLTLLVLGLQAASAGGGGA